MNVSPSLLIAGGALLVLAIATLVIRSERRAQQAARGALRDLGFVPATLSPEITERLVRLYARSRPAANYSVRNIYEQRIRDAQMFVFDLVDDSGDGDSYTEKHAVAVVSPRMNLPAFIVLPRVNSDAALSAVANKVMGWMAHSYGQSVEFPGAGGFEAGYLVASPAPDDTRRFLNAERLRRLATIGYHGVRAGGNVLVVSRFVSASRALTRDRLREQLDHAINLFEVFPE